MRSTNPLFPWFFGIALVVFIAIFIVSYIQQKKRTKALATLAPMLGFNFVGDDWGDRAPRLQTALFDKGWGQRFKNIMTGNFAGLTANVFDYWYKTGGGKSSHTWTQTVFLFLQDLWLPVFELRSEGIMDRITDAFTHKDINFDSHPQFSQHYLLRGDDKDKVRALFTPQLLSFLEGLSDQKWHIEGDGHVLLFYKSDVTVDPEEVGSSLEETASLAKTFVSSCGLRKPA